MKAKHTPTPWRAHDMEKETIVGEDHLAILRCDAISRSPETNLANKNFILLAVNAHYALVRACRLALSAPCGSEESSVISETLESALERAKEK